MSHLKLKPNEKDPIRIAALKELDRLSPILSKVIKEGGDQTIIADQYMLCARNPERYFEEKRINLNFL